MSMNFDGTAYLVTFGSSAGLSAYPATVFFYIWQDTRAASDAPFNIFNAHSTDYITCYQDATTGLSARQAQTTFATTPQATVPTGEWVPVICEYTASGCSIQTPTDLETNATAQTWAANAIQRLVVGASNAGTGMLDGKIAHFTVWDGTLSAGDKTSLLGGADPATIDAANQTRYWSFTTNDANLLVDAITGTETLSNTNAVFDASNPTLSGGGVTQTGAIEMSITVQGSQNLILTSSSKKRNKPNQFYFLH